MKYLRSFYTKINEEIINSIESSLNQLIQLSIPKIKTPLGIYTIVLNPDIGTFITYRAKAKDIYGNIAMSFTSLCYIYNSSSSVKVLIIDPHIKLRLIQENTKYLKEFIALAKSYGITNEFLTPYSKYLEVSKLIPRYRSIHFHHWEYLGEKYQIKIVEPNEDIVKELQSYKPNVIILSNLYLGFNKFDLLNWDLTTKTYNNCSILKYLLNYIRENHVGLIVTHGTLSEFSLLLNSTEFKIFSEGYIAPDFNDINLIIHESLANALGLSPLSLYKYIKNQIIYTFTDDKYLAPMQILWVPWNGSLIPTYDARTLNWYIPDEPIVIPNPYMHISNEFRAYTQIGWQLGFNSSIVEKALMNTMKYRDFIASNYGDLLRLITNNTNIQKYISMIINLSITNTIPLLQNALSNMNIYNDLIIINISQIYIKIPFTRQLLKSIIDSQALRIIAISPDYKAGIIAYDRYWDFEHGYRAIYFSFEVEAGIGNAAKILLQQAIEWCNNWRPAIGLSEQIGDYIKIPKYDANKLRKFIRKLGGVIFSKSTIISEFGITRFNVKIPNTTSLKIIIVTSNIYDLDIHLPRTLKLLKTEELTNRIRVLTIKPLEKGLHPVELKIKNAKRTLTPLFIEIRSSLRISEIPRHMSLVNRIVTKVPYLGEEIEIVLRKTSTNTTYESHIKNLIIYEIVPPGFEVIKADGKVIKTSFGSALEILIPLELRGIILEYLQNMSNEFNEYIPSIMDNITLIEFSLINISEVTYTVKAVDLVPGVLIAGSILVLETPTELYMVPGLVGGDQVLRVNPPKFTKFKFQEPDKLEIIINISEVSKLSNVSIIRAYVPKVYGERLKELTIVLPKTIEKEISIQLDLEFFRRIDSKNITIAITDEISKSILSLHILNSSELPKNIVIELKPSSNESIEDLIIMFPIVTFRPVIKVSNPMAISFKYLDKYINALSIDEKSIRIFLYNTSSRIMIELMTDID